MYTRAYGVYVSGHRYDMNIIFKKKTGRIKFEYTVPTLRQVANNTILSVRAYLYEPPTVTIAGCWNCTACCSSGCSSPGVQQVSVQNCVGPCNIPAATSSVGSPSRSSPPAHQSIEPRADAHSTPGHTVSSPEKNEISQTRSAVYVRARTRFRAITGAYKDVFFSSDYLVHVF